MNALAALAVAAGGMLGALARFGLDTLLARGAGSRPRRAPGWPAGTLLVNVAGSALIGVAYALLRNGALSDPAFAAVTAGLAGGLTTFSSWTVASVLLWTAGRRWSAVFSVLLNVVLGVAACAAGLLLGETTTAPR